MLVAPNTQMRLALGGRRLVALLLCASVSVAIAVLVQQFFAATRAQYAWGDGALLELYTIHASRGQWQLGPYSRFGWHHPGPLLFYALSPVYIFLGSHTFALNAGALAINLASLVTIAWVLVRWARPLVSYAILAVLALFLGRVGDFTISYWNPHVVVVPFAAFVLVCAALWAGRAAALPAAILFGSFLTQTHVSLAPVVAALTATSLACLITAPRSSPSVSSFRARMWSTAIAACVLVVVWWQPVAQELANNPGNLTKLAQFFGESSVGQPWAGALRIWGDATSAVFRPDFSVPTGMVVQPTNGSLGAVLATIQVVALVLAGRFSGRRGDRFHAALCYGGAVTSLLALWSITRIQDFVLDYLVFWVSILGALNWGALIGAALSYRRAARSVERPSQRPLVTMLATVGIVVFVVIEAAQLRYITRMPSEEPARRVGILTDALVAHLQDQGLRRPLVRVSQEVWSEATGVIVQLYKRGVPVAIPGDRVSLFGQPLAPVVSADAVVDIASPSKHVELSRRPLDRLVAADGNIYVHVAVGPDPSVAQK